VRRSGYHGRRSCSTKSVSFRLMSLLRPVSTAYERFRGSGSDGPISSSHQSRSRIGQRLLRATSATSVLSPAAEWVNWVDQ
jgi:hypothetical protein